MSTFKCVWFGYIYRYRVKTGRGCMLLITLTYLRVQRNAINFNGYSKIFKIDLALQSSVQSVGVIYCLFPKCMTPPGLVPSRVFPPSQFITSHYRLPQMFLGRETGPGAILPRGTDGRGVCHPISPTPPYSIFYQ